MLHLSREGYRAGTAAGCPGSQSRGIEQGEVIRAATVRERTHSPALLAEPKADIRQAPGRSVLRLTPSLLIVWQSLTYTADLG